MYEIDWDSLRAVALEAMEKAYVPYSKFPVGVAAIVDDGGSGLLVPVDDDVAFAEAVRRLVLDASLRTCMARNAVRRAREHLDIAIAAAQLDALLRDVVRAARPATRPLRPAPSPALP
jgi:glycosyltransferase involved in cell wall biosynthesis